MRTLRRKCICIWPSIRCCIVLDQSKSMHRTSYQYWMPFGRTHIVFEQSTILRPVFPIRSRSIARDGLMLGLPSAQMCREELKKRLEERLSVFAHDHILCALNSARGDSHRGYTALSLALALIQALGADAYSSGLDTDPQHRT